MAEIKHTTVDKLIPDDKNFNKGTEFGKGLLDKSFSKFGAGRSILIDKNNRIIAGNKATESFGESGGEKVIVVETTGDTLVAVKRTDIDLDSKEGRELALADNATQKADLAWDAGALDEVAGEWGIDPGEWGLETEDWETGAADGVKGEEDDFDEENDFIAVRCKPGDVWELGDHRLMCGDSTSNEDVKTLMGDLNADITITSPPYGVNDGGLRAHKEAGNNEIKPKNFYREYRDTQKGWGHLIETSFKNMAERSQQQFINIQMLADNRRTLLEWVASISDRIVDVIIWDKGHAAPQIQPNILNNNFEFVFVFGAIGGSRKLTFGNFKGNTNAVIRVPVGQNEFANVHKAVFPVAFPVELLKINSKANSVLDLFGGTGTTLIACEELGRKCYMMELDPHYCDVIIARWEKLTGKTAKKIN